MIEELHGKNEARIFPPAIIKAMEDLWYCMVVIDGIGPIVIETATDIGNGWLLMRTDNSGASHLGDCYFPGVQKATPAWVADALKYRGLEVHISRIIASSDGGTFADIENRRS